MGTTLPKQPDERFGEKMNVFLQCVAREDNLIHYRLSWSIQMNAALIGAMVMFLYVAVNPGNGKYYAAFVFPFFGFSFSYVCLNAINAAIGQIEYLVAYINKHATQGTHVDPISQLDDCIYECTGFPRPVGANRAFKSGKWAPRIISATLMLLWLGVVIYLVVALHFSAA